MTFGPKPVLENAGLVGENRLNSEAAENGSNKGMLGDFGPRRFRNSQGFLQAIA